MKNKKTKYLIIIFAVIAIAVLVFFAVRSLTDNDTGEPREKQYRLVLMENPVEAPDIQFLDMNDDVHQLSDFRGKTVIINFWAIFCPPCIEELPDFNKAVADLSELNTVILAINVTEKKSEIIDFIEKSGLNQLGTYIDLNNNGSATYGIESIPRTIVVDKDGYVRSAVIGAVTYEDLIHIATELK